MPTQASPALPRSTFLVMIVFVGAVIAAGASAVIMQRWSPYQSSHVGGPFTSTEITGKRVTEKDFLGKPAAFFFGFTFCPDLCPTTLLTLSDVMRQMGRDADRLNVVFVTVDPQRDTPEQARLYLSSFDPRIRGLSGTENEVKAMTNAFHIFVRRVPTQGGGYTMDHSASVLLFDQAGKVVGELPYGEKQAEVLAKLETLVRPAICVPGAPPRVDLWSGAKMADVCGST